MKLGVLKAFTTTLAIVAMSATVHAANVTDRKGHVIWGAYNVREWWQLGCKVFITEKITGRPNSGQNTRGNGVDDLLRVQVDSQFKF